MEFIKNALGFGTERPITTTADGKIWLDVVVIVQDIGEVHMPAGDVLISYPSKRIEGFEIRHTIPDIEIKYMGHVQDVGDTVWMSHGHHLGAKGRGARLEGIAVKLEGKAAPAYDVKYYVQMGGIPESTVFQNGEFAGTRGQARQIEGLAIWIEPRQISAEPKQPTVIPYASPSSAYAPTADIDDQYKLMCSQPSDIFEHLPTLYKYSLECADIAEFGVRSVVSTWAFLRGLKDNGVPHKKLICCDLDKSPNIYVAQAAAEKNNIQLEFIAGNDLTVDLKDGVDLLFIDTWHVYPQLIRELNAHAPKVRKYIAMHDTTIDEEHGESVRMRMDVAAQARETGWTEQDIRTGLGKAVQEFLDTHSDWRLKEKFTNNNGLTVLERVAV